jgi:hypothetical protein
MYFFIQVLLYVKAIFHHQKNAQTILNHDMDIMFTFILTYIYAFIYIGSSVFMDGNSNSLSSEKCTNYLQSLKSIEKIQCVREYNDNDKQIGI